jgi:hypothetical protein
VHAVSGSDDMLAAHQGPSAAGGSDLDQGLPRVDPETC